MKRTKFLNVFSIALAAIVSFASCEKNETPQGTDEPQNEVVKNVVNCSFSTSQEMVDFFDIAYIYSVNGVEVKKEVMKELSVKLTETYEKGNLPESVSFKVVATPKKDHKPIDEAGKYKIIKNNAMSVALYKADGSKSVPFSEGAEGSKTLSGKHFLEYVTKYPEHVLTNYTYTAKK